MSAPWVCSLRPKTLNETQAAIFICPRLIPACYPASCPYIPVSQRSPAPYSQGVSENGLPSAHVALLSVLFQNPFKILFRESDVSQTLSAFLPQLALALKLWKVRGYGWKMITPLDQGGIVQWDEKAGTSWTI